MDQPTTHELQRRRQQAHRGRPPRRAAQPPGMEREIKLEVPPAAWEGLVREMSGPDAHRLPLRAIYLDTPQGQLKAAGIALRVRREGDQWVQTVKARGASAFERIEDNVTIGPATGDSAPAADLRRHRARGLQDALRGALGLRTGERWPALLPLFEVRVQRLVRRVVEGGSVVELALDEGELLAAGRTRTIRELELELVEGGLRDLLTLAARWRSRWDLWVSLASKAARGHRLSSGELYGPAAGAQPPRLAGKPRMGDFTAAVLEACLDQVLGNAGEIGAGSQADDHVHQLRVGLRRLRTALRELPTLQAERERFEPALLEVFRGLGERRDRTHVLRKVQPLVEAAGGRPVRVPPDFHGGADPGGLVRGADFQDALLALLLRAQELRGTDGGPVRRTLRPRLRKLHGQITGDGARFGKLPEERQHRVRKRLKRLRYLGEFLAPLYPAGAVHDYLAHLKPAQEALGTYNDEVMATGLYQELVGSDPGAQFGVEWLQARRAGEAKACRKALRRLEEAPPFWKG
ncbi:MAG TPA: CHAD domain-containing protein [Ramlibacter sp.]|nr:CHAD domain-containing protein [Ramlibacter sp.]